MLLALFAALQIPAVNVALNHAWCRLWYWENADVLAAHLPDMQSCADGDALLAANPDVDFTPLDGGWYIFSRVQTQ